MHLERLEKAGLVAGSLELSAEGKAIKWYALRPFDIRLTPEVVEAVVADMQASSDTGTVQKDDNND
jgi:hypothetical protein